MHLVLCRSSNCSLRILEDMSFLSFLRILILLEEPPHLTADKGFDGVDPTYKEEGGHESGCEIMYP